MDANKPGNNSKSTSLSAVQPHSGGGREALSPLTHPTLTRPKGPAGRKLPSWPQIRQGQGPKWEAFAQAQSKGVADELAALKRPDGPTLSPPLAQYMLARSVMGEKIESGQAKRLVSSDATVTETRQLLSKGRGNVSTDIDSSGGDSAYRTGAGREMTKLMGSLVSAKHQQDNPGLLSAVGAMKVRAGNCGEHGSVATLLDAQRLETEGRHSESVFRATSSTTDHGWSERRHLDGQRRQTDVIMDAWGVGPAIERRDSAFGQSVKDRWSYSTQKMPTMDVKAVVEKIPEKVKEAGQKEFSALKDANYRPGKIWGPTHVMSDKFRQDARTSMAEIGTREKLDKGATDLRASYPEVQQRRAIAGQVGNRRPLLLDIHKVGVVRSLGGSLRKAKESV